MAENEKLSGKVGLDTGDFKTGLAGMNRELRIIESGFRASAAELGDWASTASGLELRVKSLNGAIDIQTQKVAAVRAEYERVKSEKGENSRAAQELEIKLNKENETLGKMTNELSNTETALAEMGDGAGGAGDDIEEMADKSDKSRGKLEGLKGVLGGVGEVAKGVGKAMLAIVASIAAVGAGIVALVLSSASAAAELTDLSNKTGISTTRLQELQYIGHQVGVDLDTITGANSRLIRSMYDAQTAGSAQSEAFTKIGVSTTDANGELRDSQEVFAELIDQLGAIENPTERDALAMEIFGKSAQELNPLIKEGSENLADMAAEAHDVGAVMSEENVAALEEFDDTLASLKDGLKGTLGTLSTAFLPGLQGVLGTAGGYLKELAGIVTGSGGDLSKIGPGLTTLISKIAADIAKQAPKFVQTGITIIKALIDAIVLMLPELLNAGIQIILALLNAIITALPTIIQAGIQILLTLVRALIDNLPMLIDAAFQAILAIALGLAEALPELIPSIVQAVVVIVQALVDNIPMLVEAAIALILGLAEGLIAAIPVLIPAIPQIVAALVGALIQSLPMIGEGAVQLVLALFTGIVGALPMIGEAAGEIINTLLTGVMDLWETLLEVGGNIVTGIWEGIKGMADWFWDMVLGFFEGIVKGVMEFLHMASPSKTFAHIGAMTAKGFGLGFAEQFKDVERQLRNSVGGLGVSLAAGGAGGSISSQNESFQFFGPVYVGGTPTPGSLGAAIKGRQY